MSRLILLAVRIALAALVASLGLASGSWTMPARRLIKGPRRALGIGQRSRRARSTRRVSRVARADVPPKPPSFVPLLMASVPRVPPRFGLFILQRLQRVVIAEHSAS